MTFRYDAYGNRDYCLEEQDRILEKNNARRRSKPTSPGLISPEVDRRLFMIMAASAVIAIFLPFLPAFFFWHRVGGMGKVGLVLLGFFLWYPWIFGVGLLAQWAGGGA
ncbi:MAG: hypothetical protein WCY91_02165 [Acidithiobacillus sp.]|jgi:hypothetical protein|uniref:hypothetical protein n=1 Tax=Acidithiobacillus sp. TaxID=1872118 RepID=UPI0029F6B650|nr:hypothetical protein [Acidithiobacillus ferrooxidans]MDD5003749.1 hypothetical protein [Acidithiobacillus sp.]MDD5379579.1 hypothetical protein [Acidithiobacillus sp.]MDD5575861.1 hypothetical protein [Acidithiobacillus sp.]